MADRAFFIANAGAFTAARVIDVDSGGLAVSGTHSTAQVRSLRAQFPELALIAEPDTPEHHHAKPDKLGPASDDENQLFPSLDAIQAQRDAGATVVMPRLGHIQAADSDSLRAALRWCDELEGDDVAPHLALAPTWLTVESDLQLLTKIVTRSVHPLLLSFSSNKNPLDGAKALAGHSRLFDEVGRAAVPWRTDQAGLHGYARGALGMGVGLIPSNRRSTGPDNEGKARRPQDRTPYVFIPDMLRYVQASTLQREWFVSRSAPNCLCRVCNGRPIDRFSDSDADRDEAHHHSVAAMQELFAQLAGINDRALAWRKLREDAIVRHRSLGAEISRNVRVPADLAAWAKLDRTA
ncbi:hypothetical protein [Herbiconiux liukaitaii]|uniref:hypothetical protein n=1 Tax=Herbiconiux liukaitaii TaxID=3342799 RepID=UPI0035BB3F8E